MSRSRTGISLNYSAGLNKEAQKLPVYKLDPALPARLKTILFNNRP
jgi:hypothetical protein